ncbi:LOW QUALITY PROTEIN: piggyBac transposable element-derived protein 4-like [Etheostoma spectabile]|uniref:LOW QUALITY PROTEIN: piggyBac transposable element-derived protein 4-like n=1 Tax=Etheostoma spectabile TaxID=54343 RepID=UPI0013AF733E|nr:LOW QUALITY PROTEIN: piggyBac transposable element-derived protein 4-like [Etheostoma spectabile]
MSPLKPRYKTEKTHKRTNVYTTTAEKKTTAATMTTTSKMMTKAKWTLKFKTKEENSVPRPHCHATEKDKPDQEEDTTDAAAAAAVLLLLQRPGPTEYAAEHVHDIVSAFGLFVTRQIEDMVVAATNLEGQRRCATGGKWKAMDVTDLRGYLGLLLLAGVYRSRNEALESLWHEESGRAIFRATMPIKQFHAYSRLLRFDDRESRAARRASDKLAAVREVWDEWTRQLPRLYNPGADVTVDEQLVPFRGRCAFRQYMPSKPARYGLKSWVACDAGSSYAWHMQLYTGKSVSGTPEKNLGSRVLLDVTEGLRGPRNVTCDNFFTSYALAQQLLSERRLTVVGTMRKNKPELPGALLATKGRAVFSSKFAFTPVATLVSYVPKKHRNVVLLSTLHGDAGVGAGRQAKPDIILHYNHTKGGVDNLDKLVGTYSCRRKTARWPLAVFHNILDVSAYNAFVLWRELRPEWMRGKLNKRRAFLEQLGRALVNPLIERRRRLPRTEASAALVKAVVTASRSCGGGGGGGGGDCDSGGGGTVTRGLEEHGDSEPDTPRMQSKRKRCQLCPERKDRKSHIVCGGCKRYICGSCTRAYYCAECVRP